MSTYYHKGIAALEAVIIGVIILIVIVIAFGYRTTGYARTTGYYYTYGGQQQTSPYKSNWLGASASSYQGTTTYTTYPGTTTYTYYPTSTTTTSIQAPVMMQ